MANIYQTSALEDGQFLILLEKVNTKDLDLEYEIATLDNILNDYNLNLQLLFEDFLLEEVINVQDCTLFGKVVSQKIIDIIKAAYFAQEEFFSHVGNYSNDLHFGNIGVNNNADIVFFDQSF